MTVGLDFYVEMVQLAKKLDLIILSDIAYAEIYFDDNPPPSVLQVPGAIDITVEFTSLSKTYAMPGWRMGFAVGNERLIAALARVKSYLDYGAFTPIQVAAAAALNGPQDCVDEIRATYKSRRDCLVDSFARAGWKIPPPPASMFAWAPDPRGLSRGGLGGVRQAAGREGRHRRLAGPGLRRVRRRLSCASRWSRTSTASARPPATSRSSSPARATACTTSSRWRRRRRVSRRDCRDGSRAASGLASALSRKAICRRRAGSSRCCGCQSHTLAPR